MTLHQTKVLLSDASLQRLAGKWQVAIDLSERAFRASCRDRNAVDLIESILTVAHSYREMGNAELAIEYYELAHALSHLQDNLCQSSRALNGIGIVLQQHGSMDDAEGAYQAARALAILMDDALTIGNIDMNLGTLHTVRGDLSSAHEYYNASLECYEKIDHERGIVAVLNNLGMLHIDFGHLDLADSCLGRALSISRRNEDVVSEGIIQINRTELLIARGNLIEARMSCDDAYEIFGRLDDHSGRSEALKHYGVIYREGGKPYLAETHLREAVEIAAIHTYPLQEAEAQRELALVLRNMGRNRDALRALNRAHYLFSMLQAKQDQADIDQRLAQLEADFLSLVGYWGESIEEKDKYTRGHCQRVAAYAFLMAKTIGIPKHELTWFRMGALLHDVGKTGIPADILNKPGQLLPEERSMIERHTLLGEDLLSQIEFPWDIRPMVRSHHERWDGTGYPDRISELEIPLSARILHIADVFDALTTTRSYRSRLTADAAREIMREDPGSFDPELFALFESLFERFAAMLSAELEANDSPARMARDLLPDLPEATLSN